MQYDIYATDLLILPESIREKQNLQSYCITNKLAYNWQYSDNIGQNWYNMQFLEIPFRSDLLNEIKNYFK